jgi:putative ABC transport system permease protein
MNNFYQIFSISLKAILNNKMRSFLTMLGVIIGVSSVVLLTSIGAGLQNYITQQFSDLGSNNLYVMPGNPLEGGMGAETMMESMSPVLKKRHLSLILREHRDLIREGSTMAVSLGKVKYNKEEEKKTILGVTSSYQRTYNMKAVKGEWFDNNSDVSSDRVAVLGHEIAQDLFKNLDPVGRSIKISNRSYRVVGVLEEKGGGMMSGNFDSYVYIPLNTLFDDFNFELIDNLTFVVRDQSQMKETKRAIIRTLKKEIDEDDFSVADQSQILGMINQILGMLTIGLGGIAAISLLVGGIGIMNIMLVSVTERTREIGLRKALGATPNLIMLQFLFEAALLSVIGGLIGLGLAYLGSLAMQPFFPSEVTKEAVILSFGVSLAVGLIFGVVPARKGAKLSPIEALRYE